MEKEIQVAKKIKQNQEEPSPQPDLDIGPNILDKPQSNFFKKSPKKILYKNKCPSPDIMKKV